MESILCTCPFGLRSGLNFNINQAKQGHYSPHTYSDSSSSQGFYDTQQKFDNGEEEEYTSQEDFDEYSNTSFNQQLKLLEALHSLFPLQPSDVKEDQTIWKFMSDL